MLGRIWNREYGPKIVRAIEAHHGKFVIVAKLTKPLKALVTGLSYTEVHRSLAVAECQYQPHRWPRPYRFVVVRKTLPEEDSPQTTLFTVGRYSYHAFVTNLRIWPIAVYRFYRAPGQIWRVQRVRFPPRQGLATHREPSLGLMEATT